MPINYTIRTAPYSFTCPIYGDPVKQGESCVEQDGLLFCMKMIEEKRLTPITSTPLSKRNVNPFKPGTVRWDNLMMRLELETIAENPESKVAKKIIAKYRRKMKAREERYLSSQN